MADIRIHREHRLGLPKARKVAAQWIEDVEKNFDMRCRLIEGDYSDTVEFTRSRVNGRLIVAADHFDLDAKLGIAGMPTKSARVRLAIAQLPDTFTITEIERACPGVSRPTIKLALRDLRDEGAIEVARQGRGALWRKRR